MILQIVGSLLKPQFVNLVLYRGASQTVRMQVQPMVSGGIAGYSFTLAMRKNADDAPSLGVNGTINDATGCVVDFAIGATQLDDLSGPYILDVKRTNGGNEGLLVFGQAAVVQT